MLTRRAALAAAAAVLASAAVAQATQDVSLITYIEVGPKSARSARELVMVYRNAAGKAQGVVQFEALERIGTPSHFAIVETWSSAKSQSDFAASKAATEFRSRLAPLLIASYDERKHSTLTVGRMAKQNGAIYAVTHVDFIPPKKDEGVPATKAFVDKSRSAPGALRFDGLIQDSRPNHLTLVESWKSKAAKEAFVADKATVDYRKLIGPMSGSLYDERLYKRLN